MDHRHRRITKMLRVGRELLVLLDITVLSNSPAENTTGWFTDREMMEMLMLLKDPICKHVEECAKEDLKQRKRKNHTSTRKTISPSIKLDGERLKVGLQFRAHSISRTCVTPREQPRNWLDSDQHSGGGCDAMILFPEKVQAIVRQNQDDISSSCRRLEGEVTEPPTSYFNPAASGKGGLRSAKRKKLALKRIVSSTRLSSSKNKSVAAGGGFELQALADSDDSCKDENQRSPSDTEVAVPSKEANVRYSPVGSGRSSDEDLIARDDSPPMSKEVESSGKNNSEGTSRLREGNPQGKKGNPLLNLGKSHVEDRLARKDYRHDSIERMESALGQNGLCPSAQSDDDDDPTGKNGGSFTADREDNLGEDLCQVLDTDGDERIPEKMRDHHLSKDTCSKTVEKSADDYCKGPLFDDSGSSSPDSDGTELVMRPQWSKKTPVTNINGQTTGTGSDSCLDELNLIPMSGIERKGKSGRNKLQRCKVSEPAGKTGIAIRAIASGVDNLLNAGSETGGVMENQTSLHERDKELPPKRGLRDSPTTLKNGDEGEGVDRELSSNGHEDATVSDSGPKSKVIRNIAAIDDLVSNADSTEVHYPSDEDCSLSERELGDSCGEDDPPAESAASQGNKKRKLASRLRSNYQPITFSSSDDEPFSIDLSQILQPEKKKRRRLRSKSEKGGLKPAGETEQNGIREDGKAGSSSDELDLPATSFLSRRYVKSSTAKTPNGEHNTEANGNCIGDKSLNWREEMSGKDYQNGMDKESEMDHVNGVDWENGVVLGNGIDGLERSTAVGVEDGNDEETLLQQTMDSLKDSQGLLQRLRMRRKKSQEHKQNGGLGLSESTAPRTNGGLADDPLQTSGHDLRNGQCLLDDAVQSESYHHSSGRNTSSVPVSSPRAAVSHFQETDGSLHTAETRDVMHIGHRNVVFNNSRRKPISTSSRDKTLERSGSETPDIMFHGSDRESQNLTNGGEACPANAKVSVNLYDSGDGFSEDCRQPVNGVMDSEYFSDGAQVESATDSAVSEGNGRIANSARSGKNAGGSKKFFQLRNYANAEDEDASIMTDFVPSKPPKKQRNPLSKARDKVPNSRGQAMKATDSRPTNNTAFGSLKRFDDSAGKRSRGRNRKNNRRDSQIMVTPQNMDKWWLKGGPKKEKKEKNSEVIDLVAIEEKIETSLTSVTSVSDLVEDQLQYLTQANEGYLRSIFQGKRANQRHTEYKSSSALRARMTYLVSYGDFSEDSLEVIMDSLVPMFCKKGSKYLDYVSKVLLPELLVKICMDVLHIEYEEAAKMF